MMTTYLFPFILVILNTLNSVHLSEIVQFDGAHLLGLFTKTANNLNNFKTKVPLPQDTANDLIRQIPAFMEEQCAIDCLKNIFCIRYAFGKI